MHWVHSYLYMYCTYLLIATIFLLHTCTCTIQVHACILMFMYIILQCQHWPHPEDVHWRGSETTRCSICSSCYREIRQCDWSGVWGEQEGHQRGRGGCPQGSTRVRLRLLCSHLITHSCSYSIHARALVTLMTGFCMIKGVFFWYQVDT